MALCARRLALHNVPMKRLLTFLCLAAAVPVRAQFEEALPALSAVASAVDGQRKLAAASSRPVRARMRG